MDKCATCQYYDRRQINGVSGTPLSGQCRKNSPMLNPINPKPYMIEGIWPTVREDDWCGEWKLHARRIDGRVAEATNAAVIGPKALATSPRPSPSPALNLQPMVRTAPANMTTIVTPAPQPSAAIGGLPGGD